MPLLVWSHLRWNSVFQRPHHLVTRLARHRSVVFIEEPMHTLSGTDWWDVRASRGNLVVATPMLRAGGRGFPATDPCLVSLVASGRDLLARLRIARHASWLYTPMAYEAAQKLDPEVVVYDCMDELSAFLGAPPELVDCEHDLLRRAGAVFTGGPSLYRAKRDQSRYVFCFPSSVDAAHFGRAREIAGHREEERIPRPRLGFFGVIDERFDRDLVFAIAAARPDWQIVLVGPVLKIDPASLPRAANLHYLGQRPYAELPEHLASWDVCLLPFARNESTRFISPTKTLEYMAAEKPIVTTPIRDVVEPYRELVYVGDGPEAFVSACERALSESPQDRARRTAQMRAVVAQTSWDATAAAMEQELERALWRRRPRRRRAPTSLAARRGVR